MNFKFVMKIVLAAIFSTSSVAAEPATMLAFYEISADVNGNRSLVRTSKPVEFGVPIKHKFGEYQLSFVFELAESDQFTLAATLNSISPASSALKYTMLTESFSGQISTKDAFAQSAFTIEQDDISISIALRLSAIEKK